MFGFFKKASAPPKQASGQDLKRRVVSRATAPQPSEATDGPTVVHEVIEWGGLRFGKDVLESKENVATVTFKECLNEILELSMTLGSKIAVVKAQAQGKRVLFFVDRHRVEEDELREVLDVVARRGYELLEAGVQGHFAAATIVTAITQGHLDQSRVQLEREIKRDAQKGSLWASFVSIIGWAHENKASDVDFVLLVNESKSHLAFKIGGQYIRPPKYELPTDTVRQMLGTAWQFNVGGSSADLDLKSVLQALILVDIPARQGKPKATLRLRWSSQPMDKGLVVTFRIQPLGQAVAVRSLEDGGYLPWQLKVLRRAVKSEGGMIVVAGVVNSGKSTTLAQMIRPIALERKVVGIEDPVELEIEGAYQSTVARSVSGEGGDNAFVAATKAVFRSSLDALYLGEVRDYASGLVGQQVAESGHSVYTTTHASSALGIINRFASDVIRMPRQVLSSPGFLKLLVYQALLPTNCPHCCMSPDEFKRDFVGVDKHGKHEDYFRLLHSLYAIEPTNFRLRNPLGCEHCRRDELPELNGLLGRTVVAEMVELDETMLELILEGNNVKLLRHWRAQATPNYTDANLAGKTAMECAIYKAARGEIDPREIEPRFKSFETIWAERQAESASRGAGLMRRVA